MIEEPNWCEMYGVDEPPLPGGVQWIDAPAGLITPHFSWRGEAACKHCGRIPGLAAVQETAEWMESVRAALGGRVVHCSSWCRCGPHNTAVGGAPNSYHTRGMAVDIVVAGLSAKQVQQVLRKVQGPSKLVGGLGSYGSWTHLDRGPARRWNGP
jgi:zinc D-Ala-D-Ala carboxypeptidase